jgi:hypothetical protein
MIAESLRDEETAGWKAPGRGPAIGARGAKETRAFGRGTEKGNGVISVVELTRIELATS